SCQSDILPTMVGPSKSRPPMSHRKTDLGIPCRAKSAKVVLMHRTAGISDWLIERRMLAGLFAQQPACNELDIVAGADWLIAYRGIISRIPHVQDAALYVVIALHDLASVVIVSAFACLYERFGCGGLSGCGEGFSNGGGTLDVSTRGCGRG